MKNVCRCLLAVLSLPLLAFAIVANEPTGNPREVSTMEHLYWISLHSESWGDAFVQIANINASVTHEASYDGGQGWSPIGFGATNFTGSYDGNGYTIDSLKINRPASNAIGFFGNLSAAVIHDLSLTNIDVKGMLYVGGLSGANFVSSTLRNCSTTGTVLGYQYVGGITGFNSAGSVIEYCFSNADIYCNTSYGNNKYAGGVAGINMANGGALPEIRDSYCTGDIIATDGTSWLFNAFCGENQDGNILRCYSTGSVTYNSTLLTSNGFARLLGTGSVTGNYFDSETSGSASGSGATAKTTAEMKTQSTFSDAGWNFTTIWSMDSETNDGYPYLSNNAPEVSSPITLVSFTAKVKSGKVELAWETASETNNARFVIYRNGQAIAAVEGAGTTSEPSSYSYTDIDVVPGVTYTYVLADIDYANIETKYNNRSLSVTLANDIAEADFVVGAAYPNPFNPTTVIPLQLSKDAMVNASVFDLVGREVKTLVSGKFSAGTHVLQIDGGDMTTGIYMVKITIDHVTKIRKIAMIK